MPQFAKPVKADRCPGHPSRSGEEAIALVTMSGGMVGPTGQRMAIREKKRKFRTHARTCGSVSRTGLVEIGDSGEAWVVHKAGGKKMNKRAWAMTAPLVVLVALLVASCGDDSPTGTGSSPDPTPPTADVVPRLTLVGSGLTSGSESPLAGVYVHGNYAYVGGMSVGYNTSANVGVRIVDVSDPTNPALVGRIPLREQAFRGSHTHGDAVVTHLDGAPFQGDVAIVLNGVSDAFAPQDYPQPYGLWDVTDPSSPSFLSALDLDDFSFDGGGELGDKAVAGNYFYALYLTQDRTRQLAVVDIADPRNPAIIGDLPEVNGVALHSLAINEAATRVYTLGVWPSPQRVGTHGYLYVIDVQDPSQPTEIGRYIFPLRSEAGVSVSSVFGVAVSSDDGIVAFTDGSWQAGSCSILHILDTSDLGAIRELSTFELPASSNSTCRNPELVMATDVAIRGNLVYSTCLNGGVLALDISDPTNPVEVARFQTGNVSDVALLGTDLVVATTVWSTGMYILSLP